MRLEPARESSQTLLARNLVVARLAAGRTQHALAAKADVSRATIAQIETGCGDPRLSTVAALAEAMSIPAFFLLIGPEELRLLQSFAQQSATTAFAIPASQMQKLHALVSSGMLKDRVRAGRLGAEIARTSGLTSSAAPVMSAICAADPSGSGSSTWCIAWTGRRPTAESRPMSITTIPLPGPSNVSPHEDGIDVVELDGDESGGIFGGVLRAYRHQAYDAGYNAALRDMLMSLRLAGAEYLRRQPGTEDASGRLLSEFQQHLERVIVTAVKQEHFVEDGLGI